MLKFSIVNRLGAVRAEAQGDARVELWFQLAYEPGDRIVLESDASPCHLMVQLEDSIAPACLYLGAARHEFMVPFDEKRICYSPKSFSGDAHLLFARRAAEWEVAGYRNLAFNPLDQHENSHLFPHATANVETRGESVFAARNALDGCLANHSHGHWPYQSWGINRNPDAEMRIEFGCDVEIDRAVLTTRADFPHDSHWTAATLAFSDGTRAIFPLKKTDGPQVITFAPRTVSWLALKELIKAHDESPFPALAQIEVWGHELP